MPAEAQPVFAAREEWRETAHWWVRLEREDECDEVVGPYPDEQAALLAMNESLLIESFHQEDEHVVTECCLWHGVPQPDHAITVVDLTDPDHTGVPPE